jgi:chromosome segregation ATPase
VEIRIKTPAEFRDAHVTIEIRADQDEVQSVANVLDQAERAGKVPALEAQVRDLKSELSGARGRVEGLEDRVRDLTAERDALLLKGEADRATDHDLVIAARAERDAEKQRADENREWAERTEALLENVTTERDALRLQVENARQELTGAGNKLAVVKNALTRQHEPHSKRVSEALNILG